MLKFGSEENIKKLFENGEVYMNTIKTFKEYDKQGIGDKYEGVFKINNYTNSVITLKIPNNPITLNTTKLQLTESHKEHIGNIYSTYALSNKLVLKKETHKIDKRMLIFGSHCVLIRDVKGFLDAIFFELKKQNIEYRHNIVKYHDFSKRNHDLSLFDKSHLLSYQKEHRIIALTQDDCPLKINIGSLKEYAEIYTAKEMVQNLVVERKYNYGC